MFSKQETETPQLYTEKFESYTYNETQRYYKDNQFFIGIKNNFQWRPSNRWILNLNLGCLLYTSDAADERSSVDLGGRRII